VEQRGRLWLVAGIVLVVVALLSNAPGLDTTLLLSVDEDGQAPWGSARTVDPLASDPDSSTSLTQAAWLDPLGLGVLGVRLVGVASLFVLAWALGNLPRWRHPEAAWSPWLASIVLVHPGMLFAVGRGYSEPLGALLGGVMLLTPLHPALLQRIRSGAPRERPAVLAMAVAVSVSTAAAATLLALKGLDPMWAIGWAVVLIVWCNPMGLGPSWNAHELDRRGYAGRFVLTVVLGLGLAGVLGIGSVSEARGGWWWWTFLPFAVFDVLGLYLLVGAGLWAFLGKRAMNLNKAEGAVDLLVMCGLLVGLISAYVAALWAIEGQAWDLAWWKTMVVLGNNGRHGMVLLPAAIWLIVHLHGEAPLPTERLHRAFVVLLPLALLAAAHGQTLWTDDAAEAALSHLEEGDDVLLIHDPTLAVHWLYSMHPVLSEEGPEGLVGHWRAPQAGWQDELLNGTSLPDRGDLSRVSVVVVAPGLDVALDGWEEADAGSAPWMNGGGTWRILVPEANP
jgi:hypothetical protein